MYNIINIIIKKYWYFAKKTLEFFASQTQNLEISWVYTRFFTDFQSFSRKLTTFLPFLSQFCWINWIHSFHLLNLVLFVHLKYSNVIIISSFVSRRTVLLIHMVAMLVTYVLCVHVARILCFMTDKTFLDRDLYLWMFS